MLPVAGGAVARQVRFWGSAMRISRRRCLRARARYTASTMITFSLQSGSAGNAIYVEAGGKRLLFDAGISGKQARLRLASHGVDIRRVHAVILSHDHIDHSKHAGVYARLFGTPLYMTALTHERVARLMGKVRGVTKFEAGRVLEFGAVRVHSFRTPHDAVDGLAFVVEHEGRRLGVFTDLGHVFPELCAALETVDAAYLESNYDDDMLENGPYPRLVKDRIRGPQGHISNVDAAALLQRCPKRLRWAALAHLSAENNAPDVALATARAALDDDYQLCVTPRYTPSDVLTV